MSVRGGDDQLWEMLVRYAAGDATADEARALSARIESDPAAGDALAEILMHGVAARDWAQAHPEPAAREVVTPMPRAWPAWAWPMIAAAIVLAAVFLWRAEQRGWVVRVVEKSGSVRWTGERGGLVESLSAEAKLTGGTVETLSDDATVTLAFRDGTQVTAMAHTIATLSEDGQKLVHLRAGSISADVRPQPSGQPLLIHTPTAKLQVLGTRFDVESGNRTTRLQVNEGSVLVTRLVDGHTIEVPARHETVASLSSGERLAAVERMPAVVAWSSALSEGAKGTDGEWLPAGEQGGARLRAQPKLLQNTTRGQVTIHRVAFQIPWEGLQTLQLQPETRVRLRGRTTAAAAVEVMLHTKRLRGGFAGNYFHESTRPAGTWQIELPVSAFRKDRAVGTEAPPDGLQLRHIAIYTINEDAGLEIEQVEVLRGGSGAAPLAHH